MTTIILTAIATAAVNASKEGKNSAKTICRFVRKDTGLTAKPKAPEGVDIPNTDYVNFCNAVKFTYNAACNLNANTNPKAAQALTSALYTCVGDLLKLIDPSIKLNELPVSVRADGSTAVQLVEDIRANAKRVKFYKIGEERYREENKTLSQFAHYIEGQLYTIALHTTFAADYEREYNRAKASLPARIAKAEETGKTLAKTLADAETKLNAAKSKGFKSAIAKAEKAYAAAKTDADANADRVQSLKDKLSKAEKAYADAKAAAESVPAVKADESKAENAAA
nr:MAG TPA: hypothetical protein [Caudoviricetes sp.]